MPCTAVEAPSLFDRYKSASVFRKAFRLGEGGKENSNITCTLPKPLEARKHQLYAPPGHESFDEHKCNFRMGRQYPSRKAFATRTARTDLERYNTMQEEGEVDEKEVGFLKERYDRRWQSLGLPRRCLGPRANMYATSPIHDAEPREDRSQTDAGLHTLRET